MNVFSQKLIENGLKEDLSNRPKLPSEGFRVPGLSLSGPSFPPVTSIYTIPRVVSNTVKNVNVTTGSRDDAPAIQTPPKPTVHPKFTGDPLEYSTFTRSFESQVEARVSENDVRLQYLEQYLQEELKELIKGCLHLDRNSRLHGS